jgi:hypothetical protein
MKRARSFRNSGDDTESDEVDICEDTAKSHRSGDRDSFPLVSRLLTQLGHEVIVAHERNVRLNWGKPTQKMIGLLRER